jgi:hypothetical protein
MLRACFQVVVCAPAQNFRLRQERFGLTQQRLVVGTGALDKGAAGVGRLLLERIN